MWDLKLPFILVMGAVHLLCHHYDGEVQRSFHKLVSKYDENLTIIPETNTDLKRSVRQVIPIQNASDWKFKFDVKINLTGQVQKLVNTQVVSMVFSAIIIGIADSHHKWLHPMEADYHTNALRWGLNFFRIAQRSVMEGNPYGVHSRFLRESRTVRYTDFVPWWLRYFVPWVKKSSWKAEEDYWKKWQNAVYILETKHDVTMP